MTTMIEPETKPIAAYAILSGTAVMPSALIRKIELHGDLLANGGILRRNDQMMNGNREIEHAWILFAAACMPSAMLQHSQGSLQCSASELAAKNADALSAEYAKRYYPAEHVADAFDVAMNGDRAPTVEETNAALAAHEAAVAEAAAAKVAETERLNAEALATDAAHAAASNAEVAKQEIDKRLAEDAKPTNPEADAFKDATDKEKPAKRR